MMMITDTVISCPTWDRTMTFSFYTQKLLLITITEMQEERPNKTLYPLLFSIFIMTSTNAV